MNEIQNNVYVRHPVTLEQYLMEGRYNKIFLSKNNVPSKYYTYFIDILLDTIREDIADCIEKVCDIIGRKDAFRLLFFSQQEEPEMATYARRRKWTLNEQDQFTFNQRKDRCEPGITKIPARKIALQMLDYTRELEMIV
ncbi:hypothetical protein SSS_02216 [Sarcoptes scabiei]|nr:hypothetical protein SSS_02216 [Sarcoptes scabiei]